MGCKYVSPNSTDYGIYMIVSELDCRLIQHCISAKREKLNYNCGNVSWQNFINLSTIASHWWCCCQCRHRCHCHSTVCRPPKKCRTWLANALQAFATELPALSTGIVFSRARTVQVHSLLQPTARFRALNCCNEVTCMMNLFVLPAEFV